jgi:hypothetical protein
VKLRCYVVIELKGREFKPEYAGKLMTDGGVGAAFVPPGSK